MANKLNYALISRDTKEFLEELTQPVSKLFFKDICDMFFAICKNSKTFRNLETEVGEFLEKYDFSKQFNFKGISVTKKEWNTFLFLHQKTGEKVLYVTDKDYPFKDVDWQDPEMLQEKIKVTIGKSNQDLQNDYDEKGTPIAQIDLDIRRDMSGNYIISDHSDIDIVVLTKHGKIMTIPKSPEGDLDDTSYDTQDRFFDFLREQGIVDFQTIQGSHIIGTLEAKILKPKKDGLNPIQVAIFTIGKFIENDRPYFMFKQAYKDHEEDRILDPDEEYSTELGEIPQAVEKGSLQRAYWPSGANYRVYESNIDKLHEKILKKKIDEGRLEDTKKRYPDLGDKIIDLLALNDPTNNKKYLDWMARQMSAAVDQATDDAQKEKVFSDVLKAVLTFDSNQQRFKTKDIYSFKTYKEVFAEYSSLGDKKSNNNKLTSEDSEKVYVDEQFAIYKPKTHKGSMVLGMGTKWCISGKNDAGQWDEYDGLNMDFFFIASKGKEKPKFENGELVSTGDPLYKIAITFYPDNLIQRQHQIFNYAYDTNVESEFGSEITSADDRLLAGNYAPQVPNHIEQAIRQQYAHKGDEVVENMITRLKTPVPDPKTFLKQFFGEKSEMIMSAITNARTKSRGDVGDDAIQAAADRQRAQG